MSINAEIRELQNKGFALSEIAKRINIRGTEKERSDIIKNLLEGSISINLSQSQINKLEHIEMSDEQIRINFLRSYCGLSPKQIGEKLGIKQRQINRIQNGTRGTGFKSQIKTLSDQIGKNILEENTRIIENPFGKEVEINHNVKSFPVRIIPQVAEWENVVMTEENVRFYVGLHQKGIKNEEETFSQSSYELFWGDCLVNWKWKKTRREEKFRAGKYPTSQWFKPIGVKKAVYQVEFLVS